MVLKSIFTTFTCIVIYLEHNLNIILIIFNLYQNLPVPIMIKRNLEHYFIILTFIRKWKKDKTF